MDAYSDRAQFDLLETVFIYLFVIYCVIYAGLSDVQMIYLPAGVRHLEQGK